MYISLSSNVLSLSIGIQTDEHNTSQRSFTTKMKLGALESVMCDVMNTRLYFSHFKHIFMTSHMSLSSASCNVTDPTVHGALNKIMHERGDGWIKNEGNQEQEAEHTNNTQGTKEETCVVLYIVQSVQHTTKILRYYFLKVTLFCNYDRSVTDSCGR